MASIPPNPRRVGYIDPIHRPLDEPLYMGSHIHQHGLSELVRGVKWTFSKLKLLASGT